jgi:hypothetical protein
MQAIEWAIGWTVLGIVAFLIWAKVEKQWPFGPKQITEHYLHHENRNGAA